jgi:thioredoxin-related protein
VISSRLYSLLLLLFVCSGCAVSVSPRDGEVPLQTALRLLDANEAQVVMVYFWSPACVPCKVFEKRVLNTQQFQMWRKKYVFTKVRFDGSQLNSRVARRLRVQSVPAFFLITEQKRFAEIELFSSKNPECGVSCLSPEEIVNRVTMIIGKDEA